jgi:hypothetical protein
VAKRLAITIAGAVSLGSYEAGVLYELLRAVRTYNEAAISPDQKIYVDVLTGASAGGMTAAMVAQRLMYDAASLEGEFTNSLYQAWVKRISLMGLVKMRWGEKKWHSLFSSDLVDSIGKAMLVTSMDHPGSGPHASVELIDGVPQKLRVGLAITNLNGIDYMIPIVGSDDDGFNYTTSVDQKLFAVTADGLFEVAADGKATATQWKTMGAFPAAFRPKGIDRSVDEFGDRLPPKSQPWQGKTYVDWTGPSPQPFPYSDGGVLQNQPLGIAKNLVDDAMAEREQRLGAAAAHRDDGDRLYVFVTPHSVKSTAQHLHAGKITIWDELKQLFHVYLRQAMFHDWINAEDLNQNIKLLDERASDLAKAIANHKLNITSLQKASSDLNTLLIKDEEPARLARLRQQYRAECDDLAPLGQQAVDAFLSALATLEAAAQLERRDKMKIVAVVADARKELAGNGLSAFVGFFKESFRQHDYWVGRKNTRVYLQRSDVRGILGVTNWPEAILPAENDLSWKTPLPNPSGVTLPLSSFQVASAAAIPAIIMVLLRPALLVVLLLLGGAVFSGVWYLVFHVWHLLHG